MKKLGFLLMGFLSMTFGAQAQEGSTAYDYVFEDIHNEKVKLSDYKGKVILVVNTASKCGLTPQYEGLQQLHEKYAPQGLVVIGVPSPNFMNQEFENEKEIEGFTKDKYQITFPLMKIENVIGSDAHPFYKWAGKKAGLFGKPKWNFHKYLIDRNGQFATYFGSTTKPTDVDVVEKIESLLGVTHSE